MFPAVRNKAQNVRTGTSNLRPVVVYFNAATEESHDSSWDTQRLSGNCNRSLTNADQMHYSLN